MNRILIIDDDKELCALIEQSVLLESIEADCCYLSLIRRYTRFNPKDGQLQTFDFDGLVIDFNNRSIHAVNGVYELPPKEFDLLLLLAKNQGKILTKQQIYENVWGEDYVYDDSNIMAIISRLRKKIEENLYGGRLPSGAKGSSALQSPGRSFPKSNTAG